MQDEMGNTHQVYLVANMLRERTGDGQWTPWAERNKQLVTMDSAVILQPDGWYLIEATGIRVRPIEPI